MDINRANIAAVFVGPDGIQQRLPGIDPVGIAHQKFHNVKFLGGQIGNLSAAVGT